MKCVNLYHNWYGDVQDVQKENNACGENDLVFFFNIFFYAHSCKRYYIKIYK